MGRLGSLTSLAFGRSAFQPPELEEDGDFILGLHAHDLDNKPNYVQQFDERGHPKNDSSKATIRAMQHAQNAVLETVGVVVRREEASKSVWQRQSKKDKMEDIINENTHGIVMREVGPFVMQSSMWWVMSLRRRMQAFRCYLGLPVLHIAHAEIGTVGLLSFFTDGLLPTIASYVLNIFLMGMQSQKLEISFEITLRGTQYTWKPFTSFTAGLLIPMLVFPVKAFAVLQSLHLIPSTFHLSPWSFVPFTTASPIQLPSLLELRSVDAGFAFAASICYNPFIVSLISDVMKSYVHNAMYRIILLTLTTRPDRPDDLTIRAARRDQDNYRRISLHGIGPANNAERLSRVRTSDFWTEFGRELGFLAARVRGLRDMVPWLKPAHGDSETEKEGTGPPGLNDAQLRARSQALQRQMVRADLENLRENQDERLRVQRQAHAWALAEFGIAHAVDIDDEAFLLPAYEIFDSDSTTTPEAVDLTVEAITEAEDLPQPPLLFGPFTSNSIHDREEREGEGRMLASLALNETVDLRAHVEVDSSNTFRNEIPPEQIQDPSQTPSGPSGEIVVEEVGRLAPVVRRHPELPDDLRLQEDYPDEVTNVPEGLRSPPPQAPESPLDRNSTPPAISRNRARSPRFALLPPPPSTTLSSSSEGYDSDSDSIRPRRRRARTRTHPLPRSQPPGDRAPRYDSPSSDDRAAHSSRPRPRHRVTMLSVFPAEMYAECLAGLVTSAVTLPLDTLYVRRLVHAFLSSPNRRPGAGVAALGLRGDVYGMNEWFGGGAMGWDGRLRYAGLMVLMLGVQGCISSLSWSILTRVAVSLGKQSGWGQL